MRKSQKKLNNKIINVHLIKISEVHYHDFLKFTKITHISIFLNVYQFSPLTPSLPHSKLLMNTLLDFRGFLRACYSQSNYKRFSSFMSEGVLKINVKNDEKLCLHQPIAVERRVKNCCFAFSELFIKSFS